mmetsp:Transcript_24599/g.97119  ORF Transcript_24599/g.97119 Transcript_24599/m.97119 type:complete len:107 (+) Transcript_24599:947-1267(+)
MSAELNDGQCLPNTTQPPCKSRFQLCELLRIATGCNKSTDQHLLRAVAIAGRALLNDIRHTLSKHAGFIMGKQFVYQRENYQTLPSAVERYTLLAVNMDRSRSFNT